MMHYKYRFSVTGCISGSRAFYCDIMTLHYSRHLGLQYGGFAVFLIMFQTKSFKADFLSKTYVLGVGNTVIEDFQIVNVRHF